MQAFRSISVIAFLTISSLHLALAQTIRGTVLDDSTSSPITATGIAVLNALGEVVTQAVTDSAGRFELAVRPGAYSFRVVRIGYAPTLTTVMNARGDRDEITVVIRVPAVGAVDKSDPYALAPILAEAPPVERFLSGFYRRQERGEGDFALREDFERWNPQQPTDVVRRMQGFSIMPNVNYMRPLSDGSLDTREYVIGIQGRAYNDGRNECAPLIFIDGAYLGNAQSMDINNLPIDAVAAVEAYSSPLQIPLEYRRPGSGCGIVAFWTRTGELGRARPFFEFHVLDFLTPSGAAVPAFTGLGFQF